MRVERRLRGVHLIGLACWLALTTEEGGEEKRSERAGEGPSRMFEAEERRERTSNCDDEGEKGRAPGRVCAVV
jgi:hypothetical protein